MSGSAGIDPVLSRLGTLAAAPLATMQVRAVPSASEILDLSEIVLETWIGAHGDKPTSADKEGFRLLALHAQGARGEPSFNACRETCREIVYQHNVVLSAGDDAERVRALRLMIMVARHLALFVSGKLEVAGLGEFCCASRPLRTLSDQQLKAGA